MDLSSVVILFVLAALLEGEIQKVAHQVSMDQPESSNYPYKYILCYDHNWYAYHVNGQILFVCNSIHG